MKFKQLFFVLVAVVLTSCSDIYYYQLYKTQPTLQTEAQRFDADKMVYSDNICEIRYDFWSEGGTPGFVFTNKTDSMVCVDLAESFYVLNGYAYDYYLDRRYSNSVSSSVGSSANYSRGAYVTGITNYGFIGTRSITRGVSVSAASGSSVSRSYTEKDNICVPPNTSKVISEYSIFEDPIRYCNLIKYPKRGTSDKASFTEKDSPLTFGNVITYYMEGIEEPNRITHNFYVSDIENYSESDFIKEKKVVNCEPNSDKRTRYEVKYFPFATNTTFYNRYTASTKLDSSFIKVFDARD